MLECEFECFALWIFKMWKFLTFHSVSLPIRHIGFTCNRYNCLIYNRIVAFMIVLKIFSFLTLTYSSLSWYPWPAVGISSSICEACCLSKMKKKTIMAVFFLHLFLFNWAAKMFVFFFSFCWFVLALLPTLSPRAFFFFTCSLDGQVHKDSMSLPEKPVCTRTRKK